MRLPPQQPSRRRLRIQRLEDRQMLAGDVPLGATVSDTAEYLLGRVVVTPIFLDSDGTVDPKTENWDQGEIEQVVDKINTGANWWVDALAEVNLNHSLEFVIDPVYATNDTTIKVPYEPISRPSDMYDDYVDTFLDAIGASESLSLDDAMFEFNHSQRIKNDADWAFSIFIVDSSDDFDGFFPSSGSFRGAFAFAGGLYMIAPSERPAATFAHELGHIFWGLDEYSGGGNYNEHRGYYNTQNVNAFDNPTPGFQQETSIMASFALLNLAYESHISPASTLALVGWQDSDGDGILDVLDVPLSLEGNGDFDPETSTIHFTGNASATPLMNQNPSGPQSDITINRVTELQMSVDGGGWETVASPNSAVASFDLQLDVPSDFTTVAFRAIDTRNSVTSSVLTGTPTTPITSNHSVRGFAYLDTDENTSRTIDETLLASSAIEVRAADGSELPGGAIEASDQDTRVPLVPTEGMTFSGSGIATNVQVRVDSGNTDRRLFHVFDQPLDRWTAALDGRVGLRVDFDQLVSVIEVDVVGLGAGENYARVEALDASGQVISRVTTDARSDVNGSLNRSEDQTLTLIDSQQRIAAIRVIGHAKTQVGVAAVRHGVQHSITTDTTGTFSVAGLPDGNYQVIGQPQQVIHAFTPQTVTVAAGSITGGPIAFAATRVDSPRYNTLVAEDVDQNGEVSALDALKIINDLNRNDPRTLTWDELDGNKIDVTNDGMVTALDALRVINRLNEENGGGPTSEPSNGSQSRSSFVSSEPLPPSILTGSAPLSSAISHDQAIIELVGGESLGVEEKIVADSSDQETSGTVYL